MWEDVCSKPEFSKTSVYSVSESQARGCRERTEEEADHRLQHLQTDGDHAPEILVRPLPTKQVSRKRGTFAFFQSGVSSLVSVFSKTDPSPLWTFLVISLTTNQYFSKHRTFLSCHDVTLPFTLFPKQRHWKFTQTLI